MTHSKPTIDPGGGDLCRAIFPINKKTVVSICGVPIFPSFQPLGQSVFVQVLDKDGNPLEDNYKGKYPPCFIGQPGEVLKMSKDESDGPKIVTYGPFDKQTNLILNFNESGKIVEAKIKSVADREGTSSQYIIPYSGSNPTDGAEIDCVITVVRWSPKESTEST